MLSDNRYAFKEWAVACEALAAGQQVVLLRKGGIHEREGRFEVEHKEFWLFPTRFHQNPDEIRGEARPLLQMVERAAPPPGIVRLSLYAVVEEVIELRDESHLARLADLQILSEQTVAERFHYRTPGLFVLPARIYRLATPIELVDSPHFAGCRTWVNLERDLPTKDLAPVLSDSTHREKWNHVRRSLLPE